MLPPQTKNDKQEQPAVRPASWHFKFGILWPVNWFDTASKLAASKLAITDQQSWTIFCHRDCGFDLFRNKSVYPDSTKIAISHELIQKKIEGPSLNFPAFMFFLDQQAGIQVHPRASDTKT